ncbi:MAG: competence/damage-inducible protein A [Gemmatimonadaceae bacterium]|nr:competence/damage-inducible protein A [Gemmatimonadaceae bacterium]
MSTPYGVRGDLVVATSPGPPPDPNVEIVTIGDELLLGLTVDTNGAWLARELAHLGVSVARRGSVGDNADDITSAVGEALARSGAVITTGGLGPTADDLTKPAIAAIFGRDLYFDEVQWERLREIWRSRGRAGEPPEANKQQMMLPRGCTVLVNRHGSAPGIFLEDADGRWVAMLPGVPREMRGLWVDELEPLVRRRLPPNAEPIRSLVVRTTGIAESALPARLGDAAQGIDGLALAYLPGQEGVDLRLTSRHRSAAVAEVALRAGADLLRRRIGSPVYAEGATDLAEVVLERCRALGRTLAVAESCTGGLLGARLTAIPGSSDVFLGGLITYANQAKETLAGVTPEMLENVGAVSREVAEAMARAARERLGASIGIGITGIAGPGGGTPAKPVGLVWIALVDDGAPLSLGGQMIGDRQEIRFRATQTALDMIRRRLAPAAEEGSPA